MSTGVGIFVRLMKPHLPGDSTAMKKVPRIATPLKLSLAALLTFCIFTAGSFGASFFSSAFASTHETRDAQVSASSDDAYHDPTGWPNYTHTDAIYAGAPGINGPVFGGWRWTGLNIPAGATITNASVELNQSCCGWNMTTTFAFEDSAAPATFSSASTPFDRWADRTAFGVPFTFTSTFPSIVHQIPSLAAGIQELVNSYGAINEVVLLESGAGVPTGEYHSWMSFDENPGLAAKLHIEYAP